MMNIGADCHIHMALPEKELDDDAIRNRLKAYADKGITFLRDGGDKFGICRRAKELSGDYGIDYRIPAFTIYKEGHYGGFIGLSYSNLDEYKSLIKKAIEEDADFIKIMMTGILDFSEFGMIIDGKSRMKTDSDNCVGLGDEIYDLVDLAHKEGLAVMAHCNGAADIKAAVSAGVDSLEHGFYMDEEAIEKLSSSDTVWVPTISPIANLIGKKDLNFPCDDAVLKEILANHVKNISKAWSLGAMICLGTDAGAVKVEHADATESEYNFLKVAITDKELDAHLAMSAEQIKWRFSRQDKR